MSLEELRLETALKRARELTGHQENEGELLLAELIWKLKGLRPSTSEEELEAEELKVYLRSQFTFDLKSSFSVAMAASFLEVSPEEVIEDLDTGRLIGWQRNNGWELPGSQFDERCIPG